MAIAIPLRFDCYKCLITSIYILTEIFDTLYIIQSQQFSMVSIETCNTAKWWTD